MSMGPVIHSSNYGAVVPYTAAGAMTPYAQATPAQDAPPQAVDVYEGAADAGEYRFADANDIAGARAALVDILDYYVDHQLWGWPVLYTKSSVAERLRDLVRNLVQGDLLFDPREIFDVLEIHESRHVKSTKHHWQNLLVDRNKDESSQQRDSRTELEVLRMWAKCVDEVTSEETDNPNARALCSYTDYLVEGAQEVLFHSNGNWARKMSSRFESLRVSMNNTIAANEAAYQSIWGS